MEKLFRENKTSPLLKTPEKDFHKKKCQRVQQMKQIWSDDQVRSQRMHTSVSQPGFRGALGLFGEPLTAPQDLWAVFQK